MDAAVLIAYEGRLRPDDMQYAPWTEAQWAKIARALDAIEGRWMSHLAGLPDMSHIALGCALGYLDLRHAARDWRAGHPALAAWYEGIAARESMVQTAPEG
jgi:glutathione S-transferase